MNPSESLRVCTVSVVIPAYRVTAYIAEAIDSVLSQTFQDFEVIVVNDGCPDSVALEEALGPYRTKIVYLRHARNAGLAAARNTGIRAARGEFVALLDGDDIYAPQYLEVQLGMFRSHPEADMVYGSALIFGDDPCVGMPIEAFRPSHGPVTTASLLQEKVTVCVMSVIRLEMLLRVGLFDERLRKCEDFDLWLRMTKLGACILYHSQPIARYRVRGDSLSADATDMRLYLMTVTSKLEREWELTPEETSALSEARLRWAAESDLERAKVSFGQGNYRDAAKQFRNANLYFKRTKLSAATAALTWVPGLVDLVMRWRNAIPGMRAAGRGAR